MIGERNERKERTMNGNMVAVTEPSPVDELVYLRTGNISYEEWCETEVVRIKNAGHNARVTYSLTKRGKECCVSRPRNEIRTCSKYFRKPQKGEAVFQ